MGMDPSDDADRSERLERMMEHYRAAAKAQAAADGDEAVADARSPGSARRARESARIAFIEPKPAQP